MSSSGSPSTIHCADINPRPPDCEKARNDPATAEIVLQFGYRTVKRRGIGRPDHRAVDDTLDPCGRRRRYPVQRPEHVVFNPVQIIGEKLVPEIGGRAILCPKPGILFVSPDQKPVAFLPHVVFTVPVGDRWQALSQRLDFGNRLRHEILVFRRLQRQFETGEGRDFTCPQSGCIDHPVRANVSARCLHVPCPVRTRDGRRNRCKPVNLRSTLPGPCGIGMGDS